MWRPNGLQNNLVPECLRYSGVNVPCGVNYQEDSLRQLQYAAGVEAVNLGRRDLSACLRFANIPFHGSDKGDMSERFQPAMATGHKLAFNEQASRSFLNELQLQVAGNMQDVPVIQKLELEQIINLITGKNDRTTEPDFKPNVDRATAGCDSGSGNPEAAQVKHTDDVDKTSSMFTSSLNLASEPAENGVIALESASHTGSDQTTAVLDGLSARKRKSMIFRPVPKLFSLVDAFVSDTKRCRESEGRIYWNRAHWSIANSIYGGIKYTRDRVAVFRINLAGQIFTNPLVEILEASPTPYFTNSTTAPVQKRAVRPRKRTSKVAVNAQSVAPTPCRPVVASMVSAQPNPVLSQAYEPDKLNLQFADVYRQLMLAEHLAAQKHAQAMVQASLLANQANQSTTANFAARNRCSAQGISPLLNGNASFRGYNQQALNFPPRPSDFPQTAELQSYPPNVNGEYSRMLGAYYQQPRFQ